MAGIKCSNPSCGWAGNLPEMENCSRCGAKLPIADHEQIKRKRDRAALEPIPQTIRDVSAARQPLKTATPRQAKLVVLLDGVTGREFTLKGDCSTVGRWDPDIGSYPEINLAEDDPGLYVSRNHARIVRQGEKYYIEDLGSANKTIVNRTEKLTPHVPRQINSGDEILVGKTVLQFIT
jgi:pSer/pThr/pTyr-binding forkhead associated (FHA) protein